MDGLRERKRELRRQVREASRGLSALWRREADGAIRGHLLGMEELERAETVFAFFPMAAEPDLLPLLEELLRRGKRLAFPRCLEGERLEFRQAASLEQLRPGTWGIPEPGEELPLLPDEAADFAIVPCLSADRQGGRLGHGGGYYDRFLQAAPLPLGAAMVCYSPLLLPEVPREGHDVILPVLVTEEGVWRRGKPEPSPAEKFPPPPARPE